MSEFELLIADPARRRRLPGFSGSRFAAPLTALADVVVVLTPAQELLVPALEKQLHKLLILEIADGATVPTTTSSSAPLLQAHRNMGSEVVGLRLYWPRFRFDMWNWFRAINSNDPAAIEAALRGT